MPRLAHLSRSLPRLSTERILLVLIVVVALALRLNGLNWDSGYGFHPDERSLYMRAGCMYDVLTERPRLRGLPRRASRRRAGADPASAPWWTLTAAP